MKKVILCLLLLIPILVILTIDASGKLIASALVDIPVESVVIKHGGEVLESDEIYLEDYQGPTKKYTLFCEVFPGIATDEMIWESSNTAIATVVPDEKRTAADVVFSDYGSVDIVCTSKKNSSISARVTLYVGGLIPGYLTLGDYQGNVFDTLTLPRYGQKSLLASVKPARSVKEQKIAWSSSAPEIVTVDNNGVVTGIAEGSATVTAVVTAGGKTVSDSVVVTVQGKALSTQPVIYSADTYVDLTPYLSEGVTAEGGVNRSLSSLGAFEWTEVTLTLGEEKQTLYLVRLPSEKSLAVQNFFALKEGVLSAYLALGTSNLELNAIAPLGETPAYSWVSTNESILVVRDGRVYAVGSGKAEIYPQAAGYEGQHVVIHVTSPVEDFRLSENAFRDKVGLMQERVFGNQTYLNHHYSNSFPLRIASVYPAGVGIEAFTFESANTAIATVDQNGLVTFAEDVNGKSVTISATAYNQEGMPVRQSYTFRLVNGVNVGVGVQNAHFDKQAGEMPDFAPYDDLKAVTSDRTVKAVVLHTDIYFPSKGNGGSAIKNLSADVYGNGKKLDGQFLIDSVEETDKLLLWDFAEYADMPEQLTVNVYNVNMQSTQPTSEDAKSTFEELSATGGGAIGVQNPYPSGKHEFRLYVKGCLFQYAYGHVNTSIGDSEFDGCIFRNNSASAIVLQQASYGVANAKVKNCIFSNTIAPVGIACGNFNDILVRFSGKKSKESMFGKFELEGNNYIYNWKKLEEVQMDLLPRNLANSDANSLVNSFNSVLGKVIRESFMTSDAKNLYVDEAGDKWLNFSFLMIGVWENMNPQVNDPDSEERGIKVTFDPDLYQMLEIHAERAPSLQSPILSLAASFGVDIEKNKTYHLVCRDAEGKFNTMPGDSYTIGPEVYARLRGE